MQYPTSGLNEEGTLPLLISSNAVDTASSVGLSSARLPRLLPNSQLMTSSAAREGASVQYVMIVPPNDTLRELFPKRYLSAVPARKAASSDMEALYAWSLP